MHPSLGRVLHCFWFASGLQRLELLSQFRKVVVKDSYLHIQAKLLVHENVLVLGIGQKLARHQPRLHDAFPDWLLFLCGQKRALGVPFVHQLVDVLAAEAIYGAHGRAW
jgi:hypothetical protein